MAIASVGFVGPTEHKPQYGWVHVAMKELHYADSHQRKKNSAVIVK
jgi:hypothetical protein